MIYSTFIPDLKLQPVVECYWIAEGVDTAWQKITPDGFPEIIFHFKDPYFIRAADDSERIQSLSIAAGQLDHPIFIRPSGESGVIGIKFKPNGMWKVTGCDMHFLFNKVCGLDDVWPHDTSQIIETLRDVSDNFVRIRIIEEFLLRHIDAESADSDFDLLITEIQRSKGQLSVSDLSLQVGFSKRRIERLFQQQVGVSPKLYSRIVRFTYVFKLLQQPALTKAEATYLSGYFDQAHFNKEFREFTGENPEAYFSQDHKFANFFMSR